MPPIFGQVQSQRGPFASYAEVPEDHLSKKELFDDSTPLVLTHQDLNLRNIILGEDSRLWIHEPDIIHLVLEKKLTLRYLLF